MKNSYDVIVVGGSSAGSYFARRMAEKGRSVLIIEKNSRENLSRTYDIFHIARPDFEKFNLPRVTPGDGIYAFEFTENANVSPYDTYSKAVFADNIGLHKHEYMVRLNDWATEAGAEILYEADFTELVYTKRKISGVKFTYGGEEYNIPCRLVADCSGAGAVVRRSLPADYGIETFPLNPEDLFYVTLKYIKFNEPDKKWMRSKCWVYYKAWLAPAGDDADAILGIGSCLNFESAEATLEECVRNVKLPPFTVVRTENGVTPYHRALYSFVADGFICMGDAASLTKPECGEGVTANLVLADYAANVAGNALLYDAYPTREKLWNINRYYNTTQGRDFALIMSVFARVLDHTVDENEYMFAKDVFFSEKIMGGADGKQRPNAADMAKMFANMFRGFAEKKIRPAKTGETFAWAAKGAALALHYMNFPKTPYGYGKWKEKADRLWDSVGKLSDLAK